jgi:hypothetical protein
MPSLLPTTQAFGWPPEMVAEIAIGMEEPVDIAFRYGFVASKYVILEQNKAFIADVASKRAEYERDGYTAEIKAKWMATHLMDDYFIRLKSPSASLGQLESGITTLARLGQLGQKNREMTPVGAGSSVQIIFNGTDKTFTLGSGTVAEKTIDEFDTLPVWDIPTISGE